MYIFNIPHWRDSCGLLAHRSMYLPGPEPIVCKMVWKIQFKYLVRKRNNRCFVTDWIVCVRIFLLHNLYKAATGLYFFYKKVKVNVDIFFFYSKGENFLSCAFVKPRSGKHRERNNVTKKFMNSLQVFGMKAFLNNGSFIIYTTRWYYTMRKTQKWKCFFVWLKTCLGWDIQNELLLPTDGNAHKMRRDLQLFGEIFSISLVRQMRERANVCE